jgi:hypothetical protein
MKIKTGDIIKNKIHDHAVLFVVVNPSAPSEEVGPGYFTAVYYNVLNSKPTISSQESQYYKKSILNDYKKLKL